jgi:hypothetical protein
VTLQLTIVRSLARIDTKVSLYHRLIVSCARLWWYGLIALVRRSARFFKEEVAMAQLAQAKRRSPHPGPGEIAAKSEKHIPLFPIGPAKASFLPRRRYFSEQPWGEPKNTAIRDVFGCGVGDTIIRSGEWSICQLEIVDEKPIFHSNQRLHHELESCGSRKKFCD